MPGPDITRPKSDSPGTFLFFVRYAIWLGAAIALLAQPFSGHAEWNSPHLQSASTPSQPPQSQSGAAPANPTPQQPDDNGTYVIHKNVDEVLLHATVIDDKQHIVTNLDQNAFTVFEDR